MESTLYPVSPLSRRYAATSLSREDLIVSDDTQAIAASSSSPFDGSAAKMWYSFQSRSSALTRTHSAAPRIKVFAAQSLPTVIWILKDPGIHMDEGEGKIPYSVLTEIADDLFLECEDDAALLARALDGLEADIRNDLLISDLLNAYQVFHYFFRVEPGVLEMERLMLQPASALVKGVLLDEFEDIRVVFRVEDHGSQILVSDEEDVLVRYSGRDAYERAVQYIRENLWKR